MQLTSEEAFLVMYHYLREYWARFESARVADVLSDIQPARGGQTADPAAWEDWTRSVEEVRRQQGP